MVITSDRLTPWMRWLIPSLTDVLFLVLLLSQVSRRIFTDGDTGWHLWAGLDALVHGPRAIPDTLSFTRAGAPWVNVEWLADAVFAAAYRHGGYFGETVLVCVLYAALFTWLYRILLRESGNVPAAAVGTLAAAAIALLQLLARPLVFSFVLVLAAWELLRHPARATLAAWLLPPLTVLWANLHPTAFIAPALAFFVWLTRGRDRRVLIAATLSVLALGATPWGFGWLGTILPAGDNLKLLSRIDEWQTPRFNQPRYALVLFALLLAVAARRAGPRLSRHETLLGLGCLTGTLVAGRLAPIASLLWAPYLARDLAAWVPVSGGGLLGRLWRAAQDSLAPFERVFRPGLWPVLAAVVALWFAPQLAHLFPDAAGGFSGDAFPERAMAEAARRGLGPRVLNGYGWGGYISWVYGGRWKVFIDGRAGFYSGAPLDDYLGVLELGPRWAETLERRHPDWILLEKDAPLANTAPLTGRWSVVYRDSMAVILAPVARPPAGAAAVPRAGG